MYLTPFLPDLHFPGVLSHGVPARLAWSQVVELHYN